MRDLICETPECCIKFSVEYEYEPAEPPAYGYPGCPESVYIQTRISIEDLAYADAWASGCSWSLEELRGHERAIIRLAEKWCMDDVRKDEQSRAEGYADYQYEASKDWRLRL